MLYFLRIFRIFQYLGTLWKLFSILFKCSQDFESKIVSAAKAGKRTELVYLQKLFESEILLAILKSLNDTATDLDSISENLVLPADNIESTSKVREKRSLSFLASLLGSSSAAKAGASSGNGASSGGDAGVSIFLRTIISMGYLYKNVDINASVEYFSSQKCN